MAFSVQVPIYSPSGRPNYTPDDDVGVYIRNLDTVSATPFLNVKFYVRPYSGGAKTIIGSAGGSIPAAVPPFDGRRPYTANWSDSGPFYSAGSSFVLGADVYFGQSHRSAPEASAIVV